jgi:hypothetical protein
MKFTDEKIRQYASCLHCANILGCPMLSDAKGTFVLERVIKPEHRRECPDWGHVDPMQHEVRKTLIGIQGDNALRILHKVGTIIQNEEGTDEMTEDMPDFAGMLREGMMSADREEQLRFETDEEGNVVPEDLGNGETIKRPRPTYQLRKFACDPEGYIQLDHSAGMFQTQDWLIKHILKIEIDKGLITRSKRTRTTAPKAGAEPEETDNMAAGRKVLTRRGKGGAGKGPKGPKVGGPKTGRTGKPPKKTGATRDAGDEAPAGLPDAQGLDFEGFSEELQVKLGETTSRLVNEKFTELTEQLEDLRARCNDLMDGLTIFHDFMIQTGGTMQYEEEGEMVALTEMFDHERKILGHLEEGEDPSED